MTAPRKFASEAERLIRTGAGCLYPYAGTPVGAAIVPAFTDPVGVDGVVTVDPDDDTADLEREAFKREAD